MVGQVRFFLNHLIPYLLSNLIHSRNMTDKDRRYTNRLEE